MAFTTVAGLFQAIADAIRGKTGSTDTINAQDFPDAVAAIETGGSLTVQKWYEGTPESQSAGYITQNTGNGTYWNPVDSWANWDYCVLVLYDPVRDVENTFIFDLAQQASCGDMSKPAFVFGNSLRTPVSGVEGIYARGGYTYPDSGLLYMAEAFPVGTYGAQYPNTDSIIRRAYVIKGDLLSTRATIGG